MDSILKAVRCSLVLLLAPAACVSAYQERESTDVLRATSLQAQRARQPLVAGGAATAATDDASLASETKLPTVLRIALTHNPLVTESRERTRAALDRAGSTARLPDLEFKYELWGAPLRKPYALGDAQAHMFGFRQTFPAMGSLDARGRAGLEEAKMLLEVQHARELDVILQVQRAYFDYFRADQEHKIHLGHVKIARWVVEAARSNYAVAKATQTDVLRLSVEHVRIHNDVIAVEQQLQSARAQLNTLMARRVDSPLGPPAELEPVRVLPHLRELEDSLVKFRPELLGARHAVKRSEAELDGAKSSARWPSLMVGFDYMYMPTMMNPQAYGAMASITLPWLNPKHREDVYAAEHAVAADRSALESLQNAAVYQLRDAASRLDAAQRSFRIVDGEVLPLARKSLEAAKANYAAGQGDSMGMLDALRTYLQVQVDRSRAAARVASSLADLERAVGMELAKSRDPADGDGATIEHKESHP